MSRAQTAGRPWEDSVIWCGMMIHGSWSTPEVRSPMKTYAPYMATAPWAKSTTPALRYLSTRPSPRIA